MNSKSDHFEMCLNIWCTLLCTCMFFLFVLFFRACHVCFCCHFIIIIILTTFLWSCIVILDLSILGLRMILDCMNKKHLFFVFLVWRPIEASDDF